MPGRTSGAAALVLLLPLAAPVPARADDRLVAVVLVTGDEEAELAERVQGQTSDLELALVVERREPDPSGAGLSLGQAAALAVPAGARVVIWFQRDATSWLVHIAEPSEDREFVRRVAARGDLASSATAEGVALVVRGALRALAAGGAIGVAEPGVPAEASSSTRGFAAVGWRGVTAGGPTIHHGVAARAGLAFGRWHGDLSTGFYPAVQLGDVTATIEVERWSFAVGFGVDLGPVDSGDRKVGWRAGFALEAGATRFERVTVTVRGALVGTPPETIWSPTGAARARVARRLFGRAWIELGAGAEFLLRVPEFGVDSGGSFAIHTRLRPIEPFGSVGLIIDLG